jgi:glycolate oxidase
MQKYNPVTPEILAELQTIVGEKYAFTDPEKSEAYSHDETPDSKYAHLPEAVVLPKTTEEVACIVKLANREHIPVVPRGAGTGLACGAVPVTGGIVLSLERFDRIIDVNPDAMYMIVQAGVRTEEVQKAAKASGLFYAGDPCSGDSCFIGGNLATNAGGNRAVKYGTTRNQVYELELVTPLGDIVCLGSRLNKNTTGYCLEQLVMGSEGTLGIITQATLKLKPLPSHVIDLLSVFPTVEKAIAIVGIMLRSGLTPTCVEFMDNATVKSVERYLQESLPNSDIGHYIIIQMEADSAEDLENKTIALDELCSANGAISVLVADSQKIWKARKAFTEATKVESAVQSFEDVVVPVNRIPEAAEASNRIAAKYGLTLRMVSHAGDGNIHLTLFRSNLSEAEWDFRIDAFENELFEIVYRMGGRLSGEHGIGYKRKDLMQKFTDPVELDMMRRIKKALDPDMILNPGKIFDVE